jgi:alpha-beta hydrolase superfamily lysophospholipase
LTDAAGPIFLSGPNAFLEEHSVTVQLDISRRGVHGMFAALLFLALAACAPQIASLGGNMRPPAIEGDRFITRDGLALGLTQWPAAVPRAVIVALHGMNDYSNAFALPAPKWAEAGITTYAYDQRGFGRSPNIGLWPGNAALRRDLADFVDVVRARHPGLPVYALGESMGAAVVLSSLGGDEPPRVDGAILVAPGVWGWRTLPFPYRATLWVTAHTLPWMSFTGRGLDVRPTDNIELMRANARDPLFLKETRTDAIYGVVSVMNDGLEAAGRSDVDTLLLVGGNDQVIPRSATEALLERLQNRAEVRRYPGGYHMLLRDLDAEPRWSDIASWIGARPAAPLARASE